MKRLLLIVVFLLLAIGYAACNGGYSPTSPTYPTPMPGNVPTPTPMGYAVHG